jgi:hypothetical protein
MSPEFDLLDQLIGGDRTLSVARMIFKDDARFVRAVLAMLDEGVIRLLSADGSEAPRWQRREVITDDAPEDSGFTLAITPLGAKRML